MELAGTVDAIGPGVTRAVGDRVLGIVTPMRPAGGAYAELVVLPDASLAAIPDGIVDVQAATLPMNGLTVRRALDLLALEPGMTLAVTGSAGAVGGYAIALGHHAGLRVIADSAPGDEALVRELGADVVVPRGPGYVDAVRRAAPGGVDGLLDAALLHVAALPAIRDGGALAAVRAFEGASERGIAIHQVRVSDYLENTAALEELVARVQDGTLTLRVAEAIPAERAAEGHRRLERGGVRGRLVLTF
jgi:NADPH:quinone reductase-like Zn-dependent oxidoreductase